MYVSVSRREGADWLCLAQDVIGFRAAYFRFIHAFGNGRRSYAREPIAKSVE